MFEKILEIAANTKIINTHSHHREDEFFAGFNLDTLLRDTYIAWCGADFTNSKESRRDYLDKVRFKSYYVWLQKALKELYGIREDLSFGNWDDYSGRISSLHKDGSWHKKILKNQCGYERIILDTYWKPGSDNGDPEMFSPVFRTNPLFFGYSREAFDHNGNNVYNLYGREFNDIDEYVLFIRNLIKDKSTSGCVAMKNAMAYDRDLDFSVISRDKAQQIFKNKDNITDADIRLFQDFIFQETCRIAAETGIPLQCHTGMGLLEKTNALNLLNAIRSNPDTKFVLFHGGFPWTGDIMGLLHAYPNVYCDICWLPMLSPAVAEHTLHQLIEIGTSDKVCWGCDTWTSEESYGARIALNNVLASVLSVKVQKKYFNVKDAECIIKNILYDNPKSLYKIK